MGPFSLKLSSACYAAVAFASLISAQIPQGAADLESTLHAEGLLAGGTLGGATGNILDRRQDAGAVGTNQTEMDIWNEETGAACIEHLSNLKGPTNPSGTAICYNLPSLDTTTGRFMADLRLYQVSTPSGEFLGIPPSEIEVGVKYDGASVSPVTQDSAADDGGNASRKRQEGEPKLLQSYMMVGEMDLDRIPEPMTMFVVRNLPVWPYLLIQSIAERSKLLSCPRSLSRREASVLPFRLIRPPSSMASSRRRLSCLTLASLRKRLRR